MSDIFILANDVVGSRMAGPGIRYWEIGQALARAGMDVTIASQATEDFPLPLGERQGEGSLARLAIICADRHAVMERAAKASAILLTGGALRDYPTLADLRVPIVIDLYDPFLFENLHRFGLTPDGWHSLTDGRAALGGLLARGDFFLCASDRQRDMYLGMLAAAGRINPATYADDPTLGRLIGLVPFGLPNRPPDRVAGLRSTVPGLRDESNLVVWNGGLWDWFDPETAIRAVVTLANEGVDVQLLFLGTRHPNPAVGEPIRSQRSRALARDLDPTGIVVIFRDWTAYEQRGGWLRESTATIGLHVDGIETRFAWRTRLLDSLWARVPAIVTRDDALGEAMVAAGLACAVGAGDVTATANAIRSAIANRSTLPDRQWDSFAAPFTWDRVVAPLIEFLRRPRFAADRITADFKIHLDDCPEPDPRPEHEAPLAGRASQSAAGGLGRIFAALTRGRQ